MWIKICANTNLADAQLAADLGADALGFVFAPSPRRVTADQVAAIIRHLPASVEKIGVFSNLDGEEIAGIFSAAGLTGLQLHSEYSPALVCDLASRLPGARIIQTTHRPVAAESSGPAPTTDLAGLSGAPYVDAVLVDSCTDTASGGTGRAFDWEAARLSLKTLAPKPLILAGGLHPGNVQEAIAILQPWGVDVASGVEAQPGRKDSARLESFLRIARFPRIRVSQPTN